jgi:hypothetical protein
LEFRFRGVESFERFIRSDIWRIGEVEIVTVCKSDPEFHIQATNRRATICVDKENYLLVTIKKSYFERFYRSAVEHTQFGNVIGCDKLKKDVFVSNDLFIMIDDFERTRVDWSQF